MDSDYILVLLFGILFNLLRALRFCIFIAIILSWFPNAQRHPITLFFRRLSEPLFALARKVLPRTGMIDFSPIVVLIVIWFIEKLLISFAMTYGIGAMGTAGVE